MVSLRQPATKVALLRSATASLWTIRICLAAMLGLIAFSLRLWGAAEVRRSAGEILFLTALGAVWLLVSRGMFSWFGVSARDDAVERRNPAALMAICGAVVSVALIYAGGQWGEGPSYWNNIFSAGMGTAGWFGLWMLLELSSRVSVSVAEERDLASGIRLSGFLVAVGLVFARAVAGDWHSEAATLHDFIRDGWPAVILVGLETILERFARPQPMRLFPAWPIFGLGPALLYIALAAGWLCHLGPWEGMPK